MFIRFFFVINGYGVMAMPILARKRIKVEKENFRIIFMGTPEFAVSSLKAILMAGYPVVGVITAPDKPAGRGKRLRMSAVKTFALQNNLPVLQPANLKDLDFIEQLKALGAELQVVVAFRMLPEVVWAMPPFGTINLHASLLPQYRGAAPINHAIINGEERTGLTTFLLQKEIDTGQILLQKELNIGFDENVGQLHDRMMELGAGLLTETLELIRTNQIQPIDQSALIAKTKILKPAPKIFKEDCRINWNQDAIKVHNFIRGLSPYPAAYTILRNKNGKEINIKIFKAALEKTEGNHLPPGSIKTNNKDFVHVNTQSGVICLLEVQMAGRKRMSVSDFLRGFQIDADSIFL